MKSKSYRHGKHTYKSYCKPAGRGFEVGLVFGGKPVFVGNFIHAKEANTWYASMNTEIAKFSKKYWITPKAPVTFYKNFLTNHLYSTYYKFLNKCFTKYNKDFNRKFTQDARKYRKLKADWHPSEKAVFKRAS